MSRAAASDVAVASTLSSALQKHERSRPAPRDRDRVASLSKQTPSDAVRLVGHPMGTLSSAALAGLVVTVACIVVAWLWHWRQARKLEQTDREASLAPEVAAYSGRPLRILCLRGGGGASKAEIQEQEHLKRYLGNLVEFVGVDPPHATWLEEVEFAPRGADQASWDAWWAASLSTLQAVIAEKGPFDGALGCSMGASAVLCLLASVPEDTFRFVVVFDGYLPPRPPVGETIMRLLESRKPLRTPALVSVNLVDINELMGLASYLDEPDAVLHDDGRVVPTDRGSLDQIAKFLLEHARARDQGVRCLTGVKGWLARAA